MSNVSVKRDFVAEFRNKWALVESALISCSAIYVAALDESVEWKTSFISEMSDVVPRQFWNELEAVGRKWKHPKLLLGGAGANAPIVKMLPYSDQEKVFSEKVELMTMDGHILKVDVKTISSEQAEQLIDRKSRSLRDLPAQKAYIESKKIPAKSETVESIEVMPYTIMGGCVTFRRGVKLTRREIARILKELDK